MMTDLSTAYLISENIVEGILKFKGEDSAKFLQGQLTCDINELTPGNVLPGAYCSPQGRVRANFILLKNADDEFLMVLPPTQIAFLIEVMSPYVAFFKCTMSDESSEWNIFGLQAPKATLFDSLPQNTWQRTHIEDVTYFKLAGEEQRWYGLAISSIEDLAAQFASAESSPTSSLVNNNWAALDMKAGLVWIDEKNRDKFLPHDLSLPAFGAVNFEKGCYTGQEIVARMEYRGKPKYTLAVLSINSLEGLTESSAVIKELVIPNKLLQRLDNNDEIKIGQVVKTIQLKDNSWLILASVKINILALQQFQLSLSGKAILCNIEQPYAVLTD